MSHCALVGPGVASTGYMHPKSAFIYATVLEGAIQVRSIMDQWLLIAPGQFSEMPGDRHSVSENASKTEPAKLLAVFMVDTDEKELTTRTGRDPLGIAAVFALDHEMSRSGYKSTPNNLLIV